MKRILRSSPSMLVVACIMTLPALATEELAQREAVKCTVCHVKRGKPQLTDKGKYFEYKRSFAGYDHLVGKFKKCTLCHANEPGNPKMTHTGMELKTRDVTMDDLSGQKPAPKQGDSQ